jgi:hypothetical protein
MSSRLRVIGVVAATLAWGTTWPSAVSAQARVTGEVGTEVRVFTHASQFAGQERHMASSFFASSLRLDIVPGHALTFSPFVRLISDRAANEPVAYMRTLSWSAAFPGGAAEMGVQTVRWGSTRLPSPVDVVNQKDRSFHPFTNARIGQPMVRLSVRRGWGELELLTMSRVEPSLYARRPARLRSSSWIDPERVRYRAGASAQVEVAGRWSRAWRGTEVAVSALRGAARDPVLERIPGNPGPLGTVYLPSHQVGLELHWTRGDWIFRSESALRRVSDTSAYAVGVVGIERQWRGRAGEAFVAAEYAWDSRGRSAGTLTQDDLYVQVGLRSGSDEPVELTVKTLIDRENGSTVWTASLSRTVLEHWLVELGSWQFWGRDLGALRRDGYLWMSLRERF